MEKRVLRLLMCVVIAVTALSAGCGAARGEDLYTLDHIDGDITCEYRMGKNASYADECVDTDVVFDKDKFIELFHRLAQDARDFSHERNAPLFCSFFVANALYFLYSIGYN